MRSFRSPALVLLCLRGKVRVSGEPTLVVVAAAVAAAATIAVIGTNADGVYAGFIIISF